MSTSTYISRVPIIIDGSKTLAALTSSHTSDDGWSGMGASINFGDLTATADTLARNWDVDYVAWGDIGSYSDNPLYIPEPPSAILVGLATAHPMGPMSPFHWGAGFSSIGTGRFLAAIVIAGVARATQYVLPGKHHRTTVPGFTCAHILGHTSYRPVLLDGPRHVGPGVDQNRCKAGKVIGFPVHQQDARLCGNDQANLVGYLETGTAVECLIVKEYLNVTVQLRA